MKRKLKDETMQKIIMCGYYGACDSQNNVIGHVSKVTKEYFELLKESFDVYLMVSPCIWNEVIREKNIPGEKLEYSIVMDVPFTLKKRIIDKYKIMKNIWQCIQYPEADTLFFYQTDFFFYLYIYLFYHRKNKRIIALIYHQNFTGGRFEKYLNYIYKCAIKKIDGIIYTRKRADVPHNNKLYIPDYPYNPVLYTRYNNEYKKNRVICLGTMNRYKQLEELVEVFNDLDIPLEICGRFDDTTRLNNLLKNKSENVTIRDCILSAEEYYQKLGEAKYSILPYNMQQYVDRTSGVLLESIYVGSVPIAPKMLLEQNDIQGFGYEDLLDLKKVDWNNIVYHDELNDVLRENDLRIIKNRMQSFFANN